MKCFLFFFVLLLFPVHSFAQANQQWITNASGVRARTTPATSGEEVARLPIGTLVKQVDNDQRAGQVGNKNDFWYHVALPNGKDGWVFGAFLTRFDEKRRGEIYQGIATAKVKAEDTSFAECADLLRFLTAATSEVTDRATLAELELWRLLAMQKAFEKIPVDKLEQPEYQRFVNAYKASIVYSEPSGSWLVNSDLLWNLQKKYADLPFADTIAWEAANLPLPGECETDDTCHLSYLQETKARYVQLYPKGKQVEEALQSLIEAMEGTLEMMKNVATPKGNSAEDRRIRKDALTASAKLRTSVAQVTGPKKTKLLQLLTQYEKLYRS